IASDRIHVVGEILPRTTDTRHFCLPAQLTLSSYFARNTGYFRRKRAELINHRVDRILELENLSTRVSRDFPRQISARNRCGNVSDVSHLTSEIARHEIHVVGEIFPRSTDVRHLSLPTELSLRSYLARDTRYFVGESIRL